MSRTRERTVSPAENVIEENEEQRECYVVIGNLQNVGINVSDIQKLQNAGIHTVNAIQMTTSKKLLAIKGLSEAKVAKIKEASSKLITASLFCTGFDVLERRKDVLRLSTGCKAFDELLGGGIESMSITEIFGEFRTGKTQICHTLCVTAQLPTELGGGNGKVVFIDTEGTFRPDRIIQIANRFGVDANTVLDNILYARAYTHEAQMEMVSAVSSKLVEERYSLIIVDSVTALFRVDFSGRAELAERQQKLGQFMSRLMKLSEEFNTAVLISNQVVSDPSGGAMFVSDPKKPIGGHILAHSSTTRISLRKGRGDQRIAKIYDSPSLPEAECVYQLSDGGICDVKD
uniref:Meiotic recombinase Dmc1 n=1 Tax=Hirondellea gigas TaxID=1518452 RepID=A0A6A7GAV1_9CRUS